MQSAVASAERVFELLDAEEQAPEHAAPVPLTDPHGRVAFEDVVVLATPPTRPLIEDLSLVVEPGQTVAIVGPTGAGKTTLVNLIMRFYELDSGRITLDGVDITHLTRNALRSEIGMVLQDTWLFAGTIRENIAYGRPDASDEEVLDAARATFVDRFVHSLPDGYDTVLDAEASNISAGEKQLITIARAFLADPALLILDEATSSVDTRTELLVQHAMAALRTDRTSFVIAHRLSTIRDADVILVMEQGAIVEQGDHEQLLALGGSYAALYAAQFSGAAVDADDELGVRGPGRPRWRWSRSTPRVTRAGRRLELTGLTKWFGPVKAVDDLSFAVEPGRVTGFLGPNGAGKTTTLRMLLGLLTPTSGTATIGGQPYAALRDPLRVVGAGLDGSSFHPGRTARNHLRWMCASGGLDHGADRRGPRRWPGWPRRRTGGSAASRSACASGSPSAGPCSATPTSCCSTSPPTGWTPRASPGCAATCAT